MISLSLALRSVAFTILGCAHIALTIGYYVGLAVAWWTWLEEGPFTPCPGNCTPIPKYWVPPGRLFENNTEHYIAFCMLVVFHLLVRLLVYKAHEFFPRAYKWLLPKHADAIADTLLATVLGVLFLILLGALLDSCIGYMVLETECLERSSSWIKAGKHCY